MSVIDEAAKYLESIDVADWNQETSLISILLNEIKKRDSLIETYKTVSNVSEILLPNLNAAKLRLIKTLTEFDDETDLLTLINYAEVRLRRYECEINALQKRDKNVTDNSIHMTTGYPPENRNYLYPHTYDVPIKSKT